jgi:hypothetical protein
MKLKNLIVLLAILAFSSIAFSQTVIITPKKTVYTRKGEVTYKYKRTFTVTYPIVSGAFSAATKKKLENTISFWRVFETTLAENMTENWLSNAYYKVNYNKNGLLDISLTQEGSGAYPDSHTYNLVINLKTGKQVKFANVFKSDRLPELAKMVDKKLKIETTATIKQIDKGKFGENGKEGEDYLKEKLRGLEFTAETFNEFAVNDKGVTIIYDADFPHVIQEAQPNGRYFFTWAQLKPFIKADGLLGKFIR